MGPFVVEVDPGQARPGGLILNTQILNEKQIPGKIYPDLWLESAYMLH